MITAIGDVDKCFVFDVPFDLWIALNGESGRPVIEPESCLRPWPAVSKGIFFPPWSRSLRQNRIERDNGDP